MRSVLPRLVILVTTFSCLGLCGFSQAQSPAAASVNKNKLILGFRMQSWKTQHLHDPQQADQHANTLRKLGCEVNTNQHDGHIDVACRTVFWKSLALDTQEQLHQWQAWLRNSGFETLHGQTAVDQPATAAGGPIPEIVRYRLADWHTQHVHQPQEIGQLKTIFSSLGCDVETNQHGGHTDLRLRCSAWKQIELETHEAAHKWQEYLNSHGFETQHQH